MLLPQSVRRFRHLYQHRIRNPLSLLLQPPLNRWSDECVWLPSLSISFQLKFMTDSCSQSQLHSDVNIASPPHPDMRVSFSCLLIPKNHHQEFTSMAYAIP